MAYNITLLNNVTNVGGALTFINVNSSGFFFILLIVAAIILITLYAIRENTPQIRALFYGFLITLLPVVLLRGIVNWGEGLLPDWYIVTHIMFLAITGVFAYFNKNN